MFLLPFLFKSNAEATVFMLLIMKIYPDIADKFVPMKTLSYLLDTQFAYNFKVPFDIVYLHFIKSLKT